MATDRIEVTEQGDIQSLIRFGGIGEDALYHDLGLAIRVRRRANRIIFL